MTPQASKGKEDSRECEAMAQYASGALRGRVKSGRSPGMGMWPGAWGQSSGQVLLRDSCLST